MSKVLNIAYGMNGKEITSLTDKQMVAAFFMADTNLPSIKIDSREPILNNMNDIAWEYGKRATEAKGKKRVTMTVHYMVMVAIMRKLGKFSCEVWLEEDCNPNN